MSELSSVEALSPSDTRARFRRRTHTQLARRSFMQTTCNEPTAAACRYLLVMLLQRLEEVRPGLVFDMWTGVAADRDAAPAGQPHVEATFDEALRMLEMARRA